MRARRLRGGATGCRLPHRRPGHCGLQPSPPLHQRRGLAAEPGHRTPHRPKGGQQDPILPVHTSDPIPVMGIVSINSLMRVSMPTGQAADGPVGLMSRSLLNPKHTKGGTEGAAPPAFAPPPNLLPTAAICGGVTRGQCPQPHECGAAGGGDDVHAPAQRGGAAGAGRGPERGAALWRRPAAHPADDSGDVACVRRRDVGRRDAACRAWRHPAGGARGRAEWGVFCRAQWADRPGEAAHHCERGVRGEREGGRGG